MIGLIVNPVAGMGGSVGLKGTDGAGTLAEARARGAVPMAGARAARALAVLAGVPGLRLLAGGGAMGADHLPPGMAAGVLEVGPPSPRATQRLAEAMRDRGVALILFAGGDGTARDIAAVTGLTPPLLGIPCGVKMQSGVFAVSPEAAGRLAADLVTGGPVGLRRVEIMDIDEGAVRSGRIAARLYGYARAPQARNLLQSAKGSPPVADETILAAACAEVAADLAPGVTWLVGPGTTAKGVLAALGLSGTLLGVDALRDGRIVARDVTEAQSLAGAGDGPLGVVVGVTGGQGFVFGRGNQQIGAAAIRRAGRERLTILASAEKLAALPDGVLHVDTGDPALDRALEGHWRVRTGPRRSMLMRLRA